VHRPELRDDTGATEASYQIGNEVGAIARKLYDPDGKGGLIDAQTEGFDQALVRSTSLLNSNAPIFEAGFATDTAIAFADVLLPIGTGQPQTWRLVEVKSATGIKDYYLNDAAIQAFVAREAGVPLRAIAIAHIDSSWVYLGDNNYHGLLNEVDLNAETQARENDVRIWIAGAAQVAASNTEPKQNVRPYVRLAVEAARPQCELQGLPGMARAYPQRKEDEPWKIIAKFSSHWMWPS
jgi:hypothetical protein